MVDFLIFVGVVIVIGVASYFYMLNQAHKAWENWNRVYSDIHVIMEERNSVILPQIGFFMSVLDKETQAQINIAGMRSGKFNSLQDRFDTSNAITGILTAFSQNKHESYPEFKSLDGYEGVINKLHELENRLTVQRKKYNANTTLFNTKLRTFPSKFFLAKAGYVIGMPVQNSNDEEVSMPIPLYRASTAALQENYQKNLFHNTGIKMVHEEKPETAGVKVFKP